MEYGTVIIWLLGLGTAFLALLSFDEWKQEKLERETMVREVEEYRKYRSGFAYPDVSAPYATGWRYPVDKIDKTLEVQRLEELDSKKAA